MKKTIRDLGEINGKRVLVRADFNVPLDEAGNITGDARILATLPTLKYLVAQGAKVIVMSHLGRPKGQVNESLRMTGVAKRLSELLAPVSVTKLDDVVSPAVTAAVDAMQPGEIVLLENVRFEPGETKNDPSFAKALDNLADIYVNDAFGAAHRAHASTEGVAKLAPIGVAGLLMEKEIQALDSVLHHPQKPFTAIVGGSKVSSKITVLRQLLDKVNNLVIGGAMIFTFLKAQGYAVGTSMVEEDYVEVAAKLMEEAAQQDVCITLAKDVIVADKFDAEAQTQCVPVEEMPDGWMGLDVGPETIERVQQLIHNSKTILWNGPMGVFEFPKFAAGTRAVADNIAEWSEKGHCKSVLGGGDTVTAIETFGIPHEKYTHVSTGGGASLEYLEGVELPGIAVLDEQNHVVQV
ncbi:MAG: phosphoglycerate kinase [Vampirovibrio sp.]|nr:phosphoglycerate kinase [Vampirovibrio sp.]